MNYTYIGIDNGATGSIAVLKGAESFLYPTPIRKVQDYTKAKKIISRLDFTSLAEWQDYFSQKKLQP